MDASAELPHVLVVEMADDRDREAEIAVDAASGSNLAPYLAASGPGDTRLISLATVYTGGEYPSTGRLLRHSLVFTPKSNASTVTVTMIPAWALIVRRAWVPASDESRASARPVSAANTDTTAPAMNSQVPACQSSAAQPVSSPTAVETTSKPAAMCARPAAP